MQFADQMRSARRGNGGTPGYKGKYAGFRLCLKQIKEVVSLNSISNEVRSEKQDDKSYSADLLAAVKNWEVIPNILFPRPHVTIQKAVEVENYSKDGKVISKSKLSVGREVVVLGHKGDILTISPSRTSLSRGSIKMGDTDFKNSVAALFELRKKQNEAFSNRKNLNDPEIQGKPNYNVKFALNMELIWCTPGTFTMGSPKSEKGRNQDETMHMVTLTEGFYLGKYEVTQEEYEKVMGKNPSRVKGKKLPVENVDWNDAMEFCKKLTGLEKKEGRLPDGWTYNLPTEAQWEYACRAGTTTMYSWGNNINSMRANYNWDGAHNTGSDFKQTRDIGQYTANPWGFFDMHGNVWEWVSDWKANYPGGALTDPKGPKSGSIKVRRGGSWAEPGEFQRSAKRHGATPNLPHYGFRVSFLKGQ
jgi:formylglycine-generating enzyme required for sulfatase activity